MPLSSVLDAAHEWAAECLRPGGIAIDATVGNGHDTLFLIRQVGESGRVVGFDVQAAALEATRARVEREASTAAGALRLVHTGHESMTTEISPSHHGSVDAVMFNLGYLPGGEHSLTTQPETTRQALAASIDVLRPGGRVTVVVYPGHEGGGEEARAVDAWAAALPQKTYRSLSYAFVNQSNDPPRLMVVEKRLEAA